MTSGGEKLLQHPVAEQCGEINRILVAGKTFRCVGKRPDGRLCAASGSSSPPPATAASARTATEPRWISRSPACVRHTGFHRHHRHRVPARRGDRDQRGSARRQRWCPHTKTSPACRPRIPDTTPCIGKDPWPHRCPAWARVFLTVHEGFKYSSTKWWRPLARQNPGDGGRTPVHRGLDHPCCNDEQGLIAASPPHLCNRTGETARHGSSVMLPVGRSPIDALKFGVIVHYNTT
jgi:hypothetical protein